VHNVTIHSDDDKVNAAFLSLNSTRRTRPDLVGDSGLRHGFRVSAGSTRSPTSPRTLSGLVGSGPVRVVEFGTYRGSLAPRFAMISRRSADHFTWCSYSSNHPAERRNIIGKGPYVLPVLMARDHGSSSWVLNPRHTYLRAMLTDSEHGVVYANL